MLTQKVIDPLPNCDAIATPLVRTYICDAHSNDFRNRQFAFVKLSTNFLL